MPSCGMKVEAMQAQLKTIGTSGQITLGKRHAGKPVLIEEPEPGVWVIKVADVVPTSERWLHEPEARQQLDQAIRWAEEHPETRETELAALERRLEE